MDAYGLTKLNKEKINNSGLKHVLGLCKQIVNSSSHPVADPIFRLGKKS